jgi:glycosyltransferase involved in cell wall biosynthesis
MRKKVLFVRSDLKLAGPARLMLSSAVALKEKGVDVIFASSGGALVEEIETHFLHFTIPELSIEKRSLWQTIKASLKLAKIAHIHKPNIIHSFNSHAGLSAMLAKLMVRAKLFNTVLGNGKEKILRFMPFHLVAVSKSVRTKLLSYGVPSRKISVIYNSTLDDRFLIKNKQEFDKLQAHRSVLDPFVFTSVAMFTGSKGHKEIIDALNAFLKNGGPENILVKFVGDGPKRDDMNAYIRDLGLSKYFEFVGASNEVSRHLDETNIFIHLAQMETFGMVIAEANARGLPVIGSDVGGIPEVLADGETGILVDRDNASEVANAMLTFMQSPDMVRDYGWSGAQRAAQMFSQNQLAQDLLNLYSDK